MPQILTPTQHPKVIAASSPPPPTPYPYTLTPPSIPFLPILTYPPLQLALPRQTSGSDSLPPAPTRLHFFPNSLPPFDYARPPYAIDTFPIHTYPPPPRFALPRKNPVLDAPPPTPTRPCFFPVPTSPPPPHFAASSPRKTPVLKMTAILAPQPLPLPYLHGLATPRPPTARHA